MQCSYDPYVLPQIDFIGGSSQDLRFSVYYYANKEPYILDKCTANFSVTDFMDRSTPVLSKEMTADNNDNNGECHILTVTLNPEDTVDLYGKYIYQISIMRNGKIEIPGQGILMISTNTDKAFVQTML